MKNYLLTALLTLSSIALSHARVTPTVNTLNMMIGKVVKDTARKALQSGKYPQVEKIPYLAGRTLTDKIVPKVIADPRFVESCLKQSPHGKFKIEKAAIQSLVHNELKAINSALAKHLNK